MLHATPTPDFFDLTGTSLDGCVCEILFGALDDEICSRFLGQPLVPYDMAETTAAHCWRVWQMGSTFIQRAVSDPASRHQMLQQFKAQVIMHDLSDIFKEPAVASTLDNNQQIDVSHKIKAFDEATVPFVYNVAKLAVMYDDPKIFHDVIGDIRQRIVPANRFDTGFLPSEIGDFCDNGMDAMKKADHQLHAYLGWRNMPTISEARQALAYFQQVEYGQSFGGLFCQVLEKADGLDYATRVCAQKDSGPGLCHWSGHMIKKMTERYEKKLAQLIEMAGDRPEHQALAAMAACYSYHVSRDAYEQAKPHLCFVPLEDEPGLLHGQDAHDAYNTMLRQRYENRACDVADKEIVVAEYNEFIFRLNTLGVVSVPQKDASLLDGEYTSWTLPTEAKNRLGTCRI